MTTVSEATTVPRRPGSRRGRARTVLLVAATLLVVAELAVRAVGPSLPMGAGWPNLATATKVEQLDQRGDVGCTDVVFVGSSMARDDLVPDVFTGADPAGRTAYNASLDAASPELLRRWVRDQVLPTTDPGVVVIGVSSFDLNDEASTPRAALRAFDDAAYTAEGPAARIEATFTRHLAIVRHRASLRDPETLFPAIVDRLRGERATRPSPRGIDGVVGADGQGLSRRDLEYSGSEAAVRRLREQFLEPFEIGGMQAGALRQLLVEIEGTGAEAVVAVLPVTADYVTAHPRGDGDLAAFRDELRAAVAGTGAHLLELPRRPVRQFADTHHLNGAGADALSRELPGHLDAAGVPVRSCGTGTAP